MEALVIADLLLFHPSDGLFRIKRFRASLGFLPGIILFGLVMAVRVGEIYLTHAPLASVLPREADFLSELIRLVVPVLSWVVSIYMITTINEGKTTLLETFLAAAYAMLPYMVLALPIAALSNVLALPEAGFHAFLLDFTWAWVLFLQFRAVQLLNEYDFGRAIGMSFLGLIGMALLWAFIGIIATLTNQFWRFVYDVGLELFIRR
jgi:hypothetical protein